MHYLLRVVVGLAVILAVSRARAEPPTPPHAGFALSAELGVTNSDYASDYRALRLEGAMPAVGPFSIGMSLSLEQHLHAYTSDYLLWKDGAPAGWGGGSHHADAFHMGAGGVVLTLGAPWTNSVFGASIEAGAAFGTLTSWFKPSALEDVTAPGYGVARPPRPLFVSPYAQGTVVAQIPFRGHLRPFVAISGR